ncbi:MAG TPA: IPTL-CTERM sorting domain-containing protein [Candidatus Polarisedimenticolia bacterium]|nr:IPTL-CTERM sorting domain-containing protein [Candidatus Polarisedimenticolia bacterium]
MALILLGFAAQMASADSGAGNVGLTSTDTSGGGTLKGRQSDVFLVTMTPGSMVSSGRDSLVNLINANPEYSANAFSDPNDSGSNSFQIFSEEGGGVGHFELCETDPNIDHLGVSFSEGRTWGTLNQATKVDQNGSFTLFIDLVAGTDPNFPPFSTSAPPNNSPSGLNGAVSSALVSAGFTVVTTNTGSLGFTKPGDRIRSVRITGTDTGFVTSCLDLSDIAPATSQVPTLSQVGLFLLVLLMTGAALLVLRRKGAASA